MEWALNGTTYKCKVPETRVKVRSESDPRDAVSCVGFATQPRRRHGHVLSRPALSTHSLAEYEAALNLTF